MARGVLQGLYEVVGVSFLVGTVLTNNAFLSNKSACLASVIEACVTIKLIGL